VLVTRRMLPDGEDSNFGAGIPRLGVNYIEACGITTYEEKKMPVVRYSLTRDRVGEVGGWGRDPFSRNFMKPTPRRKWYLTTGRRFH